MTDFRTWKYDAVQYIREYLTHRSIFAAYELEKRARRDGFEQPPTMKHWGQALQEAQDLGLIAVFGRVKNPYRNGAMTTLWRRC